MYANFIHVFCTASVSRSGARSMKAKHGRKQIVYQGDTLLASTWLEADILRAEAVRKHYHSYIKPIYDTLKAIGCPPSAVNMDSHEAGAANWNEQMPEHFKKYCGYDIKPWMPALAGPIVKNREETEQFLRDFRKWHETLSSSFLQCEEIKAGFILSLLKCNSPCSTTV